MNQDSNECKEKQENDKCVTVGDFKRELEKYPDDMMMIAPYQMPNAFGSYPLLCNVYKISKENVYQLDNFKEWFNDEFYELTKDKSEQGIDALVIGVSQAGGLK